MSSVIGTMTKHVSQAIIRNFTEVSIWMHSIIKQVNSWKILEGDNDALTVDVVDKKILDKSILMRTQDHDGMRAISTHHRKLCL